MGRIFVLMLAAGTVWAAPASAMPSSKLSAAPETKVLTVRDGCGRGRYRNEWDHCVRFRSDWEHRAPRDWRRDRRDDYDYDYAPQPYGYYVAPPQPYFSFGFSPHRHW